MRAVCKVMLGGRSIRLIGPPGVARALRREDLSAVMVETHMSGGRVTDVWWLLYGRRGEPALRAPQGSSGEKELADWLMSLPGFDIDAMARAMRFRGNATFELWKAPKARIAAAR
ncbi:MAG TPA: hypothetical protein VN814_09555 [Caulobacteraceae bacterium]|nr:hypothetical protein [Caulobacteraceae bacterium]